MNSGETCPTLVLPEPRESVLIILRPVVVAVAVAPCDGRDQAEQGHGHGENGRNDAQDHERDDAGK